MRFEILTVLRELRYSSIRKGGNMAKQVLPILAKEFLRYGERDYRGSSYLYEVLASFVAGDLELPEIASHGQSAIPNLFFGAVHYLLMRSEIEPSVEHG